MAEREYDYVIVGGGTAGCILASRLTEDPAISVLVLEAGPPGTSWKVRMPSAYDYLFKNPRFNWCYEGEPEPHLNDRRRWAQKGGGGWSYADVLPYFKRCETWQGGANYWRGGDYLGLGAGAHSYKKTNDNGALGRRWT